MTATSTPPLRTAPIRVDLVSRREGATAGGLAAAAALVSSELVGLLLPGHPSLLQGVGDQIISSAPAGIREWLIGLVGTADKPLLLVLITVVVLAGGCVLGILARARPSLYRIGVILVSVLAAATALTLGSGTSASLGTVAIAGVGAFVGQWLYARLVGDAAASYMDPLMPTRDRKKSGLGRRQFLQGATWTAAGVAVGGGIAFAARRALGNGVEIARAAVALAKPVLTDPVVPVGAAVAGIDPAVTPNAEFYRIDTALYVPQIDVNAWSLTLGGRVAKPMSFSFKELSAMPQVNRVVTLTCVSNDVGGNLVGNARWQGVSLSHLLDLAGGPTNGAEQVMGVSDDGFTAGFPLALALDGREPFIAIAMNGVALPVEHGFPARLVVPGLYGYVSATKWLTTIRLSTFAEDVGFWVQRGWLSDGNIQSASRIDRPADGNQIAGGNYVIAGRAWHQHAGVGQVQVQVDGGPWQETTLADSMGINAWRLWSLPWRATSGSHQLRVRMVDLTGKVQSGTDAPTFPGASSGWHTVKMTVA
jgi:DMSO/TMAO reductase YedYZ molybdopterin-dependent catalytic subunit